MLGWDGELRPLSKAYGSGTHQPISRLDLILHIVDDIFVSVDANKEDMKEFPLFKAIMVALSLQQQV